MDRAVAVSKIRVLSSCLSQLPFVGSDLASRPPPQRFYYRYRGPDAEDKKDTKDDLDRQLDALIHLATMLDTGDQPDLSLALTGQSTAGGVDVTIVISSHSDTPLTSTPSAPFSTSVVEPTNLSVEDLKPLAKGLHPRASDFDAHARDVAGILAHLSVRKNQSGAFYPLVFWLISQCRTKVAASFRIGAANWSPPPWDILADWKPDQYDTHRAAPDVCKDLSSDLREMVDELCAPDAAANESAGEDASEDAGESVDEGAGEVKVDKVEVEVAGAGEAAGDGKGESKGEGENEGENEGGGKSGDEGKDEGEDKNEGEGKTEGEDKNEGVSTAPHPGSVHAWVNALGRVLRVAEAASKRDDRGSIIKLTKCLAAADGILKCTEIEKLLRNMHSFVSAHRKAAADKKQAHPQSSADTQQSPPPGRAPDPADPAPDIPGSDTGTGDPPGAAEAFEVATLDFLPDPARYPDESGLCYIRALIAWPAAARGTLKFLGKARTAPRLTLVRLSPAQRTLPPHPEPAADVQGGAESPGPGTDMDAEVQLVSIRLVEKVRRQLDWDYSEEQVEMMQRWAAERCRLVAHPAPPPDAPSGGASEGGAPAPRPHRVHAEAALMALLKLAGKPETPAGDIPSSLHGTLGIRDCAIGMASKCCYTCYLLRKHLCPEAPDNDEAPPVLIHVPPSHGRVVPWEPPATGVPDDVLARVANDLEAAVVGLAPECALPPKKLDSLYKYLLAARKAAEGMDEESGSEESGLEGEVGMEDEDTGDTEDEGSGEQNEEGDAEGQDTEGEDAGGKGEEAKES